MTPAPTIRPETQAEHHKAKWWRRTVVKLSIDRLAELTGYSSRAIYLMELGCTASGKRVSPWVWTRYKMACTGVHYTLNRKPFEWQ